MKYVYLGLSGLLLVVWIIFGNYPGPVGLPVPALGKFFSPTKGFWHNTKARAANRSVEKTITTDHPLAGGSIYFDELGIPHIFANDLRGACFLQGYVHAADRMWQMDISTRATEGRLSEVLGSRMLARDKNQLRRGYRLAAARETDSIRLRFPDDYAVLEAYSAGINSYLDHLLPEDYPVEYKLLDHEPLRWSPYRTMLLQKGMSQSLSGGFTDAASEKTRDDLGLAAYNELFPQRFPKASPVVPDDGQYPSGRARQPVAPTPLPSLSHAPARRRPLNEATAQVDLTDAPYLLMPPHPDNGSNNWAVAGKRSNTGYPLLASDPHLALTLPSIWYECQISLPGTNARGVSLPGAPGIMIGFNDDIAYGETNVGHDVTDWFAISWTDTTRTSYLLDGKETPAQIVEDTLFVKGQAPVIVRTPWTVFGPVPYTDGPYADHAMRYLAHDSPGKGLLANSSASTFLKLMTAKNYNDYNDALRSYVDPAQNFLLATRSGDIAIRPNGAFPLRGAFSGRFLNPGDKSSYNWRGYLPFDQRPVHKNPTRGYVSSANQVTAAASFPYQYHGNFGEYRGRYINRQLARNRTMNQRQMKELQLDSHSLLAEELVPILIARINRTALSDAGHELLKLISEWDYNCTGESRAATLFEQWRTKVYQLTFDELPRDSGYVRPEVWRWNDLLRNSPTHPVFDIKQTTDFRETAATLTQRAFDEILETLDGQLPPEWATYRNSRVRHLGAIPGFGSDLITTAGARFTPRVLTRGNGASWRMVVELGPQPRAWGVLPGGASGDPASEYYDNSLSDWEHGRYHELTRWRDVNEAKAKAISGWTFGR